MHTVIAVVFVERLEDCNIWSVFDDLVHPLDALDHFVSKNNEEREREIRVYCITHPIIEDCEPRSLSEST